MVWSCLCEELEPLRTARHRFPCQGGPVERAGLGNRSGPKPKTIMETDCAVSVQPRLTMAPVIRDGFPPTLIY
ncbi:hypothetical protein [Azospirillum palustre]